MNFLPLDMFVALVDAFSISEAMRDKKKLLSSANLDVHRVCLFPFSISKYPKLEVLLLLIVKLNKVFDDPQP